jgi:Protein of unknown function (DUF3102)
MSELPPDEPFIAGADAGGREAVAHEARSTPETDQLGSRVNRGNSLTSSPVQAQRGEHRWRAKGDRIEREIVSRPANNSLRRPVPRSYPVLKLAALQFDYGAISPPLVPNLQAQAKLIKSMIAKTTADFIEVGFNLIAAREQLDHGQFIDWVETEVGINGRTAQRCMALARLAEIKSDSLSLLPLTTAYRLAAKSAPSEVVDHVPVQLTARSCPTAKSKRCSSTPEIKGNRQRRKTGDRGQRLRQHIGDLRPVAGGRNFAAVSGNIKVKRLQELRLI